MANDAGYYVGDGTAFATAAQGALADTAVQNSITVPLRSDGSNWYIHATDLVMTSVNLGAYAVQAVGTPWADCGYYIGDGSAFATAAQGAKADSSLQPTGDGSGLTGVLTSLAGHNVSELANDAGFSSFSPNNAGEFYNCFGIFDGGNLTNVVRRGGNQVDLQLWNGGQTVVVLSAGQKQLIGYPEYANPVPTVAAGWADGVLRDGTGNAFLTGAYSPANPGHWAGTPPATVTEALDRLAAAVSNTGTTPVP